MILLRVLQISLLLIIARGDPIPTQQDCREPDGDDLNTMRMSVLEDFVYMSEAHVQIDEVTKQDKRTCPPRSLLSSQNSLCPTYQELDRDERRTPANILQNKCRCERCAMRRRRHYKYVCEPVFRYIPVLMRVGCTNGVYDYRIAEQKVSVACICKEKLKSKLANPTVVPTEQAIEQSALSDDEVRSSEIERTVNNNENTNLLRPELERMSEVLESLVSVLNSTQNENDVEGIQEHQRAESLHEPAKMPKTFASTEDIVDSNDNNQDSQDIPISETEKMPAVYSSREDMIESTEHSEEEISPNQLEKTSSETEKMPGDFQSVDDQPENAFIPGSQKMPTDFEPIRDHGRRFQSNERMPK